MCTVLRWNVFLFFLLCLFNFFSFCFWHYCTFYLFTQLAVCARAYVCEYIYSCVPLIMRIFYLCPRVFQAQQFWCLHPSKIEKHRIFRLHSHWSVCKSAELQWITLSEVDYNTIFWNTLCYAQIYMDHIETNTIKLIGFWI